jgi:aconitate hydratase
VITLEGLAGGLKPRMDVACTIERADGSKTKTTLLCRLDTGDEVDYYRHGGILHYVLRSLLAQSAAAGRA